MPSKVLLHIPADGSTFIPQRTVNVRSAFGGVVGSRVNLGYNSPTLPNVGIPLHCVCGWMHEGWPWGTGGGFCVWQGGDDLHCQLEPESVDSKRAIAS